MNQKELNKKLAYLEFAYDQLSSELSDLDYLLRQVGFSQGIYSVKSAARELIEEGIPPSEVN